MWSLVPLPFLKPDWTSGSSQFKYYWSLAWRILSFSLLAFEMSAIVRESEYFFGIALLWDWNENWYFPVLWLLIMQYFHFHVSQFQLLSHVRLFMTPWAAAHQASLSITNSWSLLKLTSIESVMPSNHLILCCSHLLLPSILPSIRVFSNESVLCIRWPKYWSFSISCSNEYSGLLSFKKSFLCNVC